MICAGEGVEGWARQWGSFLGSSCLHFLALTWTTTAFMALLVSSFSRNSMTRWASSSYKLSIGGIQASRFNSIMVSSKRLSRCLTMLQRLVSWATISTYFPSLSGELFLYSKRAGFWHSILQTLSGAQLILSEVCTPVIYGCCFIRDGWALPEVVGHQRSTSRIFSWASWNMLGDSFCFAEARGATNSTVHWGIPSPNCW